jgi:hypothetical protein
MNFASRMGNSKEMGNFLSFILDLLLFKILNFRLIFKNLKQNYVASLSNKRNGRKGGTATGSGLSISSKLYTYL